MAVDPLSLALGGASIAGSALENRANRQAVQQAEEQRMQNMGLIQDYGQRAIESLTPGYQASQNIRQQALNQNLGLTGSTFRPMIESVQAGDMMRQQALLSGLMGQRNAILGDPINYGALTPQSVPVNYGALSGLTSPQGLNFADMAGSMQAPEFLDRSSGIQQYIAANPDIAEYYERNKAALIEGGDPQFRTLEGYAQWHYNNYGKAENRPTRPMETQTASSNPAFTPEQVSRAISRMG